MTIDDTTFADNGATLLLIDAKVSIRGSCFIENGRPPASARDAWGCCGGAITMVRSDVEIHDSDFNANGSSGFGGAIHAIASRLTVGRSTFADNEARVGGAIMSWGRSPRVNIWSADDWTDPPRLILSRVTFQSNKATAFGGAVAFAGPVQGDGLVFRFNEAALTGGAIASWRSQPCPTHMAACCRGWSTTPRRSPPTGYRLPDRFSPRTKPAIRAQPCHWRMRMRRSAMSSWPATRPAAARP